MTPRLRFRAAVPAHVQEFLRDEYRAYLDKMTLTDAERADLCKWVAQGNSPYSNPGRIADESGREMDFVTGMRTLEEIEAETRLA